METKWGGESVSHSHSFDAGAAWVSLGMYADNTAARRLYSALGFVVEGEFSSYGPTGATPPD